MTPFEIFATHGHLAQPRSAARPARAATSPVDDVVARHTLTSVAAVERWMRRVAGR